MKTHRIRKASVSLAPMPAIVAMLFLLNCGGETTDVDQSDYNAVGMEFLTKSGVVARVMGKVEKVDHFGNGGGDGTTLYNVYKITAEKGSGTCFLTMKHETDSRWTVSQAILTFNGKNFKIPLKH